MYNSSFQTCNKNWAAKVIPTMTIQIGHYTFIVEDYSKLVPLADKFMRQQIKDAAKL